MKRTNHGFTLIELMIGAGLAGLAGAIAFTVLNLGLTLFAKNTAVNLAHQRARIAVIQMERNIHASVSVPQLVDANRVPIAGSGPAAGISFQIYADGPFKIHNNQLAGGSSVEVEFPKTYLSKLGTPSAGQRLIIPSHQIETDVTKVAGSGPNVTTLFLSKPTDVDIEITSGAGTDANVPCFLTWRVSYVAVGNELRYYGPDIDGKGSYSILSSSITSNSPFSTPATPAGAPKNKFVAAINLSTSDPNSDKRGYKSANMFLNAYLPARSILTTYQ